MRKNQVFVTTGFQLLNALEYLHITGRLGEYNEIIAIHSYPNSKKGIDQLLSYHHWDNVVYFFPKWIIKFKHKLIKQILMNFWTFMRLRSLLSHSSTIVLGSYHNFVCQVVSNRARRCKVVLLDDGSSTIAYPDYTISKTRIIEKFFRLSKQKVIPDYFFTGYYDTLKDKISSETVLLKNDYLYLKSRVSASENDSTTYFIGAPLVEEGFLNAQEYLEKVKIVSGKYKMIYVPHPREAKNKLSDVAMIVDVLSLDFPFELYLISQPKVPSLIVGFHSSIFFNVYLLFGGKIRTQYIKLPDIQDQNFKNRLAKLYEKLDLVSSELVL